MKTPPNFNSNKELFRMIQTHQCLLRMEHEIETFLENHEATFALISLLETIRSLVNALNFIILNDNFWRED